jgi:hypothetical protein
VTDFPALWCFLASSGPGELDPTNIAEINASVNAAEWRAGLLIELAKLKGYGAWELIPPDEVTPGAKIFKPRIVCKTKREAPAPGVAYGVVKERKVRVTIASPTSMLHEGIDYEAKHSSNVLWNSVRMLLAFGVQYDLNICLFDMESFYLNGVLDPSSRMILMRQIPGYEELGKEKWLCRLLLGVYGLPQAGNIAQKKLYTTCTDGPDDFERLTADDCVYRLRGKKLTSEGYAAFGSHVDDLFAIGDDNGMTKTEAVLGKQFKVKWDLDPEVVTGVQLMRDREKGWAKLHQAGYIEQVLDKCGMTDCNHQDIPIDPGVTKGVLPELGAEPLDGWDVVKLYQCLIGMLLWAAIKCRPDILFAVSFLGRFTCNAGRIQVGWAKGVLRYLAGTRDWGLGYQRRGGKLKVQACCDADFAGCVRTSRSTSGIYASYGPHFDPRDSNQSQSLLVSRSFLERKVATSTGHSETHAAHDAVEEVVWLRHLAAELGEDIDYVSPIFCDNAGVVQQSTKQVNHCSAKHYRVAQAAIRQHGDNKSIKIENIGSVDNTADISTKALPKALFFKHRARLMGPQHPE